MQALQELPPPPPLSNAGTNISKTMAREFEKLGGIEVFTAAATKLSKHVVALRTAIKDLADPVEQSVLLVELEFHLSNLPLSLRETSQWDDAFSTLKRQLHPEIEAMMQLKNQTAKFLMTLGKYLDKKTAFHDADAFLKIAPKGLAVLAKNISAHKSETERYELLVHFSRALSELAQSDAANEHPDFKLWMSTFISKDLWPAAGSTSTERIQALRTEFEQRVPDDAAWVEAHTEKSIRRSIESTFNRTADRTPPKLAKTCIDIVTAIGRAPLNSASKKQLVGELTAELAPFAQAARGPTPNDDPVLKMLVQVWNAIASEMQNNRSWPDLTADHQLMVHLTHAQHWRDDRH